MPVGQDKCNPKQQILFGNIYFPLLFVYVSVKSKLSDFFFNNLIYLIMNYMAVTLETNSSVQKTSPSFTVYYIYFVVYLFGRLGVRFVKNIFCFSSDTLEQLY